MVDITYSSGSNTITVVGGSSGSPHTFIDIYNADVAGSWGKVTKDSSGTQFTFAAKLMIGDGSTTTYFADTEKQIVFLSGCASAINQTIFGLNAQASLRLGRCTNTASKSSDRGCSIIFLESSYYMTAFKPGGANASVELYGCYFYGLQDVIFGNAGSTPTFKVWNCILSGRSKESAPHIGFLTYGDVFNVQSIGGSAAARAFGINVLADKLYAVDASRAAWFQSGAGVIRNLYGRNLTNAVRMDSVPSDCYLINPDFSSITIYWGGTSAGKLFRQYEFDLQVVDSQNNCLPIQGARYRIFDKNGVELTKTGSGYTSVPNVTLSAPAGGGTQATAHAVLDPNGYGQISGFVVDNAGSGYISAPTTTIDAPSSGVQATAQATLTNGSVSAITPTTFTDANGNIPTRCVTRGYYDQAHGDVLQDYAPLLIIISKDGFMDYRDEMSIAMKTAYQISMNRTVPVIFTAGGRRLIDMKPTDPQSLMYLEL
jgi:hypothetical protein